MRTTYTHTIGTLSEEDREFFERVNPGYYCTGETLTERIETKREDGNVAAVEGTTYVVMRGHRGHGWTPYGMCRDCGDHYVIARWSRYDRIDKADLRITFDVDDR